MQPTRRFGDDFVAYLEEQRRALTKRGLQDMSGTPAQAGSRPEQRLRRTA